MTKDVGPARDAFLARYASDPEFRLRRLKALRAKHFRRNGGPYARSNQYDAEISKAARARHDEEGR